MSSCLIWLRRRSWLSLALALTAACDGQKDETRITPGPGPAAADVTVPGDASVAQLPGGGGADHIPDASADAAPDAEAGASGLCVVGPLSEYCDGVRACPNLADARQSLRLQNAAILVQRPCMGPGATARVIVSGSFASHALAYVYAADSGELVGVEQTQDVPAFCSGTSFVGYHGEASLDCRSHFPDDSFVPAECPDPDAGAPGADAGPYECVLTE